MQTLYLARHGIAESPALYTHDRERELSFAGKEQLLRTVRTLRSWNLDSPHICSSPYVRAQQTARILQTVWGDTAATQQIQTDARLEPNGSPQIVLDLLRELDEHPNILLVSHNPLVSFLTSILCAEGRLHVNFEPGTIACLDLYRIHPVQAELRWYCPPELLAGN